MASGRTFGGMVLAILKWIAATTVVIAGVILVIVFGVHAYQYLTHGRHASQIDVWVRVDKGCDDPKYPVFMGVENKTSKTIATTDVTLKARRKGRSSNLATYENLKSDTIIPPGYIDWSCWGAPLKSSVKDDPRELEWSVRTKKFSFE